MRGVRRIEVLAAVALVALAGCASDESEFGTYWDPLMIFPTEATWSWDESANLMPRDGRFRALVEQVEFESLFREAVTHELAARGYHEVPLGQPIHYLLSYQLSVGTRIRPEESFSIGSLSLRLVEAASKRRAWVGFMRAEIEVNRSDEERRGILQKRVKRMLEEFPPSGRS